jgi:hypothetical protein
MSTKFPTAKFFKWLKGLPARRRFRMDRACLCLLAEFARFHFKTDAPHAGWNFDFIENLMDESSRITVPKRIADVVGDVNAVYETASRIRARFKAKAIK